MTTKWKYCISLLIALILGFNIYQRSSMPPYGHPINELSDNYWGIITDIAHRWRHFDFSLWNMGQGGGSSLFTSGQYPLLNPTNALAWILNDDQFYLVKLIEPYVLGCFFMMVLLWDVFKARWYIAIFGGLAYIGLTFAKSTTMAESPYFLYGCGLFPAMVIVAIKLFQRHVYLAAAGVGAFLALQFLGEGVTQVPQLLIWWVLFFTICLIPEGFKPTTLKKWFFAVLILIGTNVGLSALQMIPTWHFFHLESARIAGHYHINNYPIYAKNPPDNISLAQNIWGGLIDSGPIRTKGILVLILVSLSLACLHFGRIFTRVPHRNFIYQVWAATILYFLIPTASGIIGMPTFMTFFTFEYGLHILDFCMILSICLILNNDQLVFRIARNDWVGGGAGIIFLLLALSVCVAPILLILSPELAKWTSLTPYFISPNFKYGLNFFFKSLILIFLILARPSQKISRLILIILLIGMGFMMTLDCFKWYEKGSRTHPELFQLDSPEHKYYAQAQGKYFFPYLSAEPQWSIHNYNLLYGVYGTCGDMALAPRRLVNFQFYYNNRLQSDIPALPFEGNDCVFLNINDPIPSSFITYFPVDFTMIHKGDHLPWNGFTKAVSGDQYDVYQRSNPTPHVYFANSLQIVPLAQLVRKFEQPRSDIVYVAAKEDKSFGLLSMKLASQTTQARYMDYEIKKEGHMTFKVMSDRDIFVIVPQRFEKGWEVTVDGTRVQIFPADYLFIGFYIPGGEHRVELRYIPPGFWAGIIVTIMSIFGIIGLFRTFDFWGAFF